MAECEYKTDFNGLFFVEGQKWVELKLPYGAALEVGQGVELRQIEESTLLIVVLHPRLDQIIGLEGAKNYFVDRVIELSS